MSRSDPLADLWRVRPRRAGAGTYSRSRPRRAARRDPDAAQRHCAPGRAEGRAAAPARLPARRRRGTLTPARRDGEAWEALAAPSRRRSTTSTSTPPSGPSSSSGAARVEAHRGRGRRTSSPSLHRRMIREKRRDAVLDPRWTEALGLTDGAGRAPPAKRDKHRQVLRFVEVLDHLARETRRARRTGARVAGRWLGSGGAHVRRAGTTCVATAGRRRRCVGSSFGRALAAKSRARLPGDWTAHGLSFVSGSIGRRPRARAARRPDRAARAATPPPTTRWPRASRPGAQYLLVAPLLSQGAPPRARRRRPPPRGGPSARDPEDAGGGKIATDALRAALLGAAGYEARVFEFVSSEHTDKNLMISRGAPRGQRRAAGPRARRGPRPRELLRDRRPAPRRTGSGSSWRIDTRIRRVRSAAGAAPASRYGLVGARRRSRPCLKRRSRSHCARTAFRVTIPISTPRESTTGTKF